MKRIHFYLLITSGMCPVALISSDFHLITHPKSYDDAKTYCRHFYGDLATVHNLSDMNHLMASALNDSTRAWIGLENGRVWRWHWSQPDQILDYVNWGPGEPQNKSRDGCAAMDGRGRWFESDCAALRSFLCQETNEAALRASASQTVWIGLFKDPWRWSDGSPASFRHWKPSQPNYLKGQDCVVTVFSDQGKWNDLRCGRRHHFVCRGARKYVTTTTAATSDQEPTRTTRNTTAVEIWTHLTVWASTNASSEAAAVSQLTPNATDGATRSPTPEVTTARLPSQPTGGSVRSENLILIRENLTWIQALSYCRKNHVDLVHITTRDVQEKVAAIVKNSTSPHVWTGLRYTCLFNFWFWATSAPGCYQNWAPGQGPQRDYGCRVTGAVQATGGQQWVGLPDGERLNFICSACAG
ncbi:C-type mannose receptor 2-like isoform X3 [Takifugu rubripes]|uniref:C-type mannose receptor 2-like isoform X3 n=1 Tax=Takifugu rubripes TaxID=31033 RepID=UPI001145CE74|nr:C-type mannose receptor 2-like isoform X3 [Takifugu rubripes]